MLNTNGVDLKTEGQERAVSGASDWFRSAQKDIMQLARSGRSFTADDLIAITGLPNERSTPNSNNAVGPVFSWARRQGLIQVVGYGRTSRRRGRARNLTVWKGVGGDA